MVHSRDGYSRRTDRIEGGLINRTRSIGLGLGVEMVMDRSPQVGGIILASR